MKSTLKELDELCARKEQESLILEYKSCHELRKGTIFGKKNGIDQKRDKNSIRDEISKDVSAFLNAAGGTIIFGIETDQDSRATKIENDLFKADENISAEWFTELVRRSISPPPAVNVYTIPINPKSQDSDFLLVADIPQGEQAYQAADKRFYKRVGPGRQPMEQHEIVDVMNRTKGAALKMLLEGWQQSSSENALRITILPPGDFGGYLQRAEQWEMNIGNRIIPNARSIIMPWNSYKGGGVIFPGDWFNFFGNGVGLTLAINSGTF